MLTPGRDLDAIARQYLWDVGLDYPHPTGYGVGQYLTVHEGAYLSVCLYVCLLVRLSVSQFVRLFIYLFLYLFVWLFILCFSSECSY